MAVVNLILSSGGCRRWHHVLVERLLAAGHEVGASVIADRRRDWTLGGILAIDRCLFRIRGDALAATVPDVERALGRPVDLTIDLSRGNPAASAGTPVMTVYIQGDRGLGAAAAHLARGYAPTIELVMDGKLVAHAEPMADSRLITTLGLDDVLARAISLVADMVNRFPTMRHPPATREAGATARGAAIGGSLAGAFIFSSLPRLVARRIERLRYHGDHWRVGYRFHDGPGVAATGSLAGAPWQVLPDDGSRYYADPFPCEWEGRHFIFVEELRHASCRGVLSVATSDGEAGFDVPRVILEEPHHLSYPQVFYRDGQHWMIPESGAGRNLVLYRADRFPDRWSKHRVLVEDSEIFDATLVDHDGLLWLVGTARDGAGSASDMMVVFFAERLEGPWHPHPSNPVIIDRAAARPGGAVTSVGDRLVLPVQDGTERYGGGLGLCEIVSLDTRSVEFSRPSPIDCDGHWPHPRIHTMNRAGRLETIDGLARVPRPR